MGAGLPGWVLLISEEAENMTVSYKKLWKLLIDREMLKKDLQEKAGISWASVTKMSKCQKERI